MLVCMLLCVFWGVLGWFFYGGGVVLCVFFTYIVFGFLLLLCSFLHNMMYLSLSLSVGL